MSKFARKIRKNINKISKELLRKLTMPDSECDSCTKDFSTIEIDPAQVKMTPTSDVVGNEKFDACYLTCPELYARNLARHKDLVDKAKAITGDERLKLDT